MKASPFTETSVIRRDIAGISSNTMSSRSFFSCFDDHSKASNSFQCPKDGTIYMELDQGETVSNDAILGSN